MKIITEKQQDEALIYLINLNDALISEDEIKRVKAIEYTAELAYIIGGIKLMRMVMIESFGVDGEEEEDADSN